MPPADKDCHRGCVCLKFVPIHLSAFPPNSPNPPFPPSSSSYGAYGGSGASWSPPPTPAGAFGDPASDPADAPFAPADPFDGAPSANLAPSSTARMRARSLFLTLLAFLLLVASLVLVIIGLQNMLLTLAGFGAGLLAFVTAEAGDGIDKRRRAQKELPGRLWAAILVRLAAAGVSIVAAWRAAEIAAI